jgi:protein-tyrosine phosphatase
MSDPPLQVLMVCTGNICRSPMMERMLQDSIDRSGADGAIVVRSAGTAARPGEPMQPFAAAMLTQYGVNAENFGATALTEELVSSSDLVVTATRDHRSLVVGLVPAAVRRTFTLLELARVASTAPAPTSAQAPGENGLAAGVLQAVAWAAQMRGSVSRREESVDDLDDPLGAPLDVYRQRAAVIASAVEQIVPFLIGGRAPTAAG